MNFRLSCRSDGTICSRIASAAVTAILYDAILLRVGLDIAVFAKTCDVSDGGIGGMLFLWLER